MRSGSGPEATVEFFSFQLGTRLTEIGPLYDPPNESVILLVKNAAACGFLIRAAVQATGARSRGNHTERALPSPRSGAIMNTE
jgi:hypothetical protein